MSQQVEFFHSLIFFPYSPHHTNVKQLKVTTKITSLLIEIETIFRSEANSRNQMDFTHSTVKSLNAIENIDTVS